jgi:hypothetical protein
MKEELLHFVWRTRRFDLQNLKTTEEQEIRIEQFGNHNRDQGPDFSNARIWIDETLWAGNVEMHLRSSDWYNHRHETDPAYDNVILHVVWEDDMPVRRSDNSIVPTLIMKERIAPGIVANYQYLTVSETWVPCEKLLHKISEFTWKIWLENVGIERLISRTQELDQILKNTNNDLEDAFYRVLLRSFGLPQNKEPFERLARACPIRLLEKHRNNALQIEALLFGQAGLFPVRGKTSDYVNNLQKEYNFLKVKYKLESIPAGIWKFARMRPVAFPTLRIAQIASLLQSTPRLFNTCMETRDLKDLKSIFSNISLPEYWQRHYRFEDEGKGHNGAPGEGTIDILLINAVLPFMFFYGRIRGLSVLEDKAIRFFQQLKPEVNTITRSWKNIGVPVSHALDAQAVVHLKKQYCTHRRCLSCAIGAALIHP